MVSILIYCFCCWNVMLLQVRLAFAATALLEFLYTPVEVFDGVS